MTLSAPAPLRSTTRRAPARPPVVHSARASAGARAGAYLIDIAIVAVVGVLVWLISGSLVLTAVAVIELWAIGWIWEGHTGATPGNLACGIRTVRKDADVSVGAGRMLWRSLVMALAHVIPVLLPVGLAASGALDGLAGARVIDVRKGTGSAPGTGIARMPDLEARVIGAPGVIDAVPGAPGGVPGAVPGAVGGVPGAVGAVSGAVAPAPGGPASAAPAAAPVPVPALAQPVPSEAGTVPVFELSDGSVIRATGLGFIGRAPRAPESIPEAILVRVPDGARSLSRTHAAFGVEDGELWVQDLGSANGASVRHLGGGSTALTPHTPYFLVAGDVLVLGGDAELAFRRVVDRTSRRAAAPAPAVPVETPAPAADAAPPAPAPSPAPARVALQFQDGTVVPIHSAGYIGRAPTLPEGERPDAALIAVPDGDRSVSRTHGRFGIVGDQTWFEDLGSGNGSSLRTGDGRSGPMTPNQRFGLVPGMVLQLGDCVIRVIDAD